MGYHLNAHNVNQCREKYVNRHQLTDLVAKTMLSLSTQCHLVVLVVDVSCWETTVLSNLISAFCCS